MKTLTINIEKCLSCNSCKSVCICNHLEVNTFVVEKNNECIECGHCTAICPSQAIKLTKFLDKEDKIEKIINTHPSIEYDDFIELLKNRRSVRYFTKNKVDKKTLNKLFKAAYYSPSSKNTQTVEYVVIDEKLDELVELVYDILKDTEYPIAQKIGAYLNDEIDENPLTFEGQQVILGFSENPIDTVINMSRLEIAAYSLGIGGFYCGYIALCDTINHDKFMKFFPEISNNKHLHATYVLGYPRKRFKRTVPRDDIKITYK